MVEELMGIELFRVGDRWNRSLLIVACGLK